MEEMDFDSDEEVVILEVEEEEKLTEPVHVPKSLHDAICSGLSSRHLQFLLKTMPINLAERDIQGDTVLHTAAFYDEVKINVLKVILKYNRRLTHEVDENGNIPLHVALSEGREPLVIRLLLQYSNVYKIGECGNTVLHFAALGKCNNSVFKMLLRAGAEVNKTNEDNVTALHLAVSHSNSVRVLKTLLHAGADTEVKDYLQRTPLHYAASRNANRSVFEVLLQHGCNVSAVNIYGQTPLHDAVMKRCDPIVVRLMLQYSEDIRTSNVKMKSILKLAFSRQNHSTLTLEVAKELMRAPASSRVICASEKHSGWKKRMLMLAFHLPGMAYTVLQYAMLQNSTIKRSNVSENKLLKTFHSSIHLNLSWMRKQRITPELTLLDMVKEVFAWPDWRVYSEQRWYNINPDAFNKLLNEFRNCNLFVDELKQVIRHLLADRILYSRLKSNGKKKVTLNSDASACVFGYLSAEDCCSMVKAAEPNLEDLLKDI